MKKKIAIIIGAGPAGLTAAYELLKNTDIQPIIFEKSKYIGGLAQTINYKNNKLDIGPHRFFSKSDTVINWWLTILPLEKKQDANTISYHGKTRTIKNSAEGLDPDKNKNVMLVRKRKTRIYFSGKLFNYPISLTLETLKKLGIKKTFKIISSYFYSLFFPIKDEKNLEDFFINRFGRELYQTFFQSYTEKVWGLPCNKIDKQWGEQRIKGISLIAIVKDFFKKRIFHKKITETSLIEKFLYPKYGAGQMWTETAKKIKEMGGEIFMEMDVQKLLYENKKINSVDFINNTIGQTQNMPGDYFISSMPISHLVESLHPKIPAHIYEIGKGLQYRDLIVVGILLKNLKIKNKDNHSLIEDNWIYIHEKGIRAGRIQISNNMSPYLPANPKNIWIGVEYFCNETDDIWKKNEKTITDFCIDELSKIHAINSKDILDTTVIKMPKAYPAYFGTYSRFQELKEYIDCFENLFLVGRNGMHKYNNQDHSMLTAMAAVENIKNNITSKDNIWAVNTEEDYHEEKSNK